MQWILIGGILLMNSFPQLLIGIVLFCGNNFSLVTLPVEYDASHRALGLRAKKTLHAAKTEGAKDALTWAARTYVVAALGLSLLYCIMFPFIWNAAED
jgi:Zn-dependent membrane protease YugP